MSAKIAVGCSEKKTVSTETGATNRNDTERQNAWQQTATEQWEKNIQRIYYYSDRSPFLAQSNVIAHFLQLCIPFFMLFLGDHQKLQLFSELSLYFVENPQKMQIFFFLQTNEHSLQWVKENTQTVFQCLRLLFLFVVSLFDSSCWFWVVQCNGIAHKHTKDKYIYTHIRKRILIKIQRRDGMPNSNCDSLQSFGIDPTDVSVYIV